MKARELLFAAALGAAISFVPSAPALAGSESPTGANAQVVNTAPTGRTDRSADAQNAGAKAQTDQSYQLGAGDKVRLSVFGESDLGGEFLIDGSGDLRLPLIGQVKAAGLTVHDFEEKIVKMLEDGYLRDPRVSIEVVNYRPFYIIGEVNKPGQYPYVDGMNALNAIALAGGYTARANKSDVYLQRNGQNGEQEFPSDETTKVQPGDVVRIPERFF
jgi:polysaccharide export outer membrane protein